MQASWFVARLRISTCGALTAPDGSVTLLFAVLIVAINLLTDLTQAALDPRVGQEIGG